MKTILCVRRYISCLLTIVHFHAHARLSLHTAGPPLRAHLEPAPGPSAHRDRDPRFQIPQSHYTLEKYLICRQSQAKGCRRDTQVQACDEAGHSYEGWSTGYQLRGIRHLLQLSMLRILTQSEWHLQRRQPSRRRHPYLRRRRARQRALRRPESRSPRSKHSIWLQFSTYLIPLHRCLAPVHRWHHARKGLLSDLLQYSGPSASVSQLRPCLVSPKYSESQVISADNLHSSPAAILVSRRSSRRGDPDPLLLKLGWTTLPQSLHLTLSQVLVATSIDSMASPTKRRPRSWMG